MYGILLDTRGEKKLTVNKGQEIIIGRDENDGEGLYVEDEFVSRKHASISFEREFVLKDLHSRNGSYINGEPMKRGEALALTDGDVLRFGSSEYRFRIARPVREGDTYGGYVCSIKNSAGGRRLRIELKERGCRDHQLRMIEENPQLCIAEIIYVKNIESDCILCDIGGCLNLTDHIKHYKKNVNAEELVEKILRVIKLGEEHLLERKRYVIYPETVFLDKDDNIRLIYVPGLEEKADVFSLEIRGICRYLSKSCTGKDRQDVLRLGEIFENKACSTAEYIKLIYGSRDIGGDKEKNEYEEVKWKDPANLKYAVTLVSFLLFMVMFWIGIPGTGAVFILLAAVNICIYVMPEDAKKKVLLLIEKLKSKK